MPTGQERRLKKWPALMPSKDTTVIGVDRKTACADIVLSSTGKYTRNLLICFYIYILFKDG